MPKDTTEQEIEVEYTTREDYIAGAYQCLIATEGFNSMTKQQQELIKNIQNKSLLILNLCIDEMYNELFDEEVK